MEYAWRLQLWHCNWVVFSSQLLANTKSIAWHCMDIKICGTQTKQCISFIISSEIYFSIKAMCPDTFIHDIMLLSYSSFGLDSRLNDVLEGSPRVFYRAFLPACEYYSCGNYNDHQSHNNQYNHEDSNPTGVHPTKSNRCFKWEAIRTPLA